MCIAFEDNYVLSQLFGDHDGNLIKMEQELGVTIASRGEMVSITGEAHDVDIARSVLRVVYDKLEKGEDVSTAEFDSIIRMMKEPVESIKKKDPDMKQQTVEDNVKNFEKVVIQTPKKRLNPRSHTQARYMRDLLEKELIFASGPAGTGKTYIAVAAAVAALSEG